MTPLTVGPGEPWGIGAPGPATLPDLLDPFLYGDPRLALAYRYVREEDPDEAAHALRCDGSCMTRRGSESCEGGSHSDCAGCSCTCHPRAA